ncbi:MAG: hypothetical protein R2912_10955 [Eubacteriales bacterium]
MLATTPVPTATAAPTATPKPALPEDITVTRSDSANPAQFGFSRNQVNSKKKTSTASNQRFNPSVAITITAYCRASLPLAGNNYRNSPAYETARPSPTNACASGGQRPSARSATGAGRAGRVNH